MSATDELGHWDVCGLSAGRSLWISVLTMPKDVGLPSQYDIANVPDDVIMISSMFQMMPT